MVFLMIPFSSMFLHGLLDECYFCWYIVEQFLMFCVRGFNKNKEAKIIRMCVVFCSALV